MIQNTSYLSILSLQVELQTLFFMLHIITMLQSLYRYIVSFERLR